MPIDRKMFSEKLSRYMAQLEVSADDLAVGTGFGPERLRKLLECQSDPTGDEILILADFFRCDFKFFISNERLAAFEQTEALYRKYGTELSREDRWAIQELLFLCESQQFLIAELRGSVPKPPKFAKRGDHFKTHGIEAAEQLREHLQLRPNLVVSDVYRTFRDMGVHVFRRKLGKSTISGLFVRSPVAGPCVLVNYSESVARQRFTAAHEAGHALLDDDEDFSVSYVSAGGGDLREVRANAFASAFLLPASLLASIPDNTNWKAEKILQYAVRLQVSAEALSYALEGGGLISKAEVARYRDLRLGPTAVPDPELPPSLSARSRARKVELLQRGLSDTYVELCFEAYNQSIVSRGRLAELLFVSESELVELSTLYGRPLSYGD